MANERRFMPLKVCKMEFPHYVGLSYFIKSIFGIIGVSLLEVCCGFDVQDKAAFCVGMAK